MLKQLLRSLGLYEICYKIYFQLLGTWFMTRYYLPLHQNVSDEIWDGGIRLYRNESGPQKMYYSTFGRFVVYLYNEGK